MSYSHVPVLLNEAIDLLKPEPGKIFVDATLGGGGYSLELLEKVAPQGMVVSIDLDRESLDNFKNQIENKGYKDNSITVHSNFTQIDEIVGNHKLKKVDGIVADIGLSSFHLDSSGRGMTFQKREILDMRFDATSKQPTAAFILNTYSAEELETIFTDFGEERYARNIAKAIKRYVETTKIHFTDELVEIIKKALPGPVKFKWIDSCRRIFQALRIAVNWELENLKTFLPKALDILSPGGVLVIVTFHSLEDRIVKHFFLEASKGCVCPSDFPMCVCGKEPKARILTKKALVASEEEQKNNPRSKSAKLRAITKV